MQSWSSFLAFFLTDLCCIAPLRNISLIANHAETLLRKEHMEILLQERVGSGGYSLDFEAEQLVPIDY